MAFTQKKLDRSVLQASGIFNKYIYETGDTIAEVTSVGYFSESRFALTDNDETNGMGWNGGIIECSCSNGYLIGKVTNDGLSITNAVPSDSTIESKTFDSLTSAIVFVTANPASLERLSTDSYRNAAECLALSVPYPDGGGGDYTINTPFGVDDGGSIIDAGTKQLALINLGTVNIKQFGAVGDGVTDDGDEIKAARAAFGSSSSPDGDYPDSLNGEFYLYPANAETEGGNLRYSVGGTTQPVTDPKAVMMIEKTMNTNKGALGNFDAGGLYVQVNKKGGDALITAITGYVRAVDGTSDAIGVHGRVALNKKNNNDLTGSEGFGLWAYADINPTGGGLVTEGVGMEIDVRNRGDNIPFSSAPLPPGSMQGTYRGLIIVTADSSAGYCSEAIDIGAQSGSAEWYTGIRLRQGGIASSAAVGQDTCQMRVQGSVAAGDRYGGISYDTGELTYGIDFSSGAVFQNDRAINLATNQKIFFDGNAGFRNVSYDGTNFNLASMGLSVNGVRVVGPQQAAVSADATDLATAITLINELKNRLEAHGLIAS